MEVLQVVSELEPVLELYRERKPKRVLEIGTWDGGTLREWLREKPKAVVSVDLDHRNPLQFRRWCKPPTKLHLITGDSLADATKDQVRALGPYDWIFVDGDHGYDAAHSDAQLGIECAAPGALLLLHDIADQAGDGPLLVLEELGRTYETATFVDAKPERWGHGIGAVWL